MSDVVGWFRGKAGWGFLVGWWDGPGGMDTGLRGVPTYILYCRSGGFLDVSHSVIAFKMKIIWLLNTHDILSTVDSCEGGYRLYR
jgi:hypothetical protein